jgi:transketolase
MTAPIKSSPAIKFQRPPLDEICIDTMRTLAIDAIQAANSGHPGTPIAKAAVGYYLWQLRSFGASAPLEDLKREFWFTVERIVDPAREQGKRAIRS